MSAGFRPLQALWQSSFCVGSPLARQAVQWGAWLVSTTPAPRLLSTTPILLHPKSPAIRGAHNLNCVWSINNSEFWKHYSLRITIHFIQSFIESLALLNFSARERHLGIWRCFSYPHFLSLPHVSSPSRSFARLRKQSCLLAADPTQPAFLPNIYFLNHHEGMESNLACFSWWGTALAVLDSWDLINYKSCTE